MAFAFILAILITATLHEKRESGNEQVTDTEAALAALCIVLTVVLQTCSKLKYFLFARDTADYYNLRNRLPLTAVTDYFMLVLTVTSVVFSSFVLDAYRNDVAMGLSTTSLALAMLVLWPSVMIAHVISFPYLRDQQFYIK